MPLRIGQEVQALLRRHLSPVNAAFRRRLPIWGERGASNVIGTIELLTGAMIALGARYPLASLAGGAMGVFTFCVTLSFSLDAPAFWQVGYGAPFLGSTGQFLMKDAVLLAACYALAVNGQRRMRPGD